MVGFDLLEEFDCLTYYLDQRRWFEHLLELGGVYVSAIYAGVESAGVALALGAVKVLVQALVWLDVSQEVLERQALDVAIGQVQDTFNVLLVK